MRYAGPLLKLMTQTDIVKETISGLEDEENFFELVRMRAKLGSQEAARELTAFVFAEMFSKLPQDTLRWAKARLPESTEEDVDHELEQRSIAARPADRFSSRGFSLKDLEHSIGAQWQVDLEQSARMAAAVGFTIAELWPTEDLQYWRRQLPRDFDALFPERNQPRLGAVA
jgi:uncharacterized protein (DUF2267 family)